MISILKKSKYIILLLIFLASLTSSLLLSSAPVNEICDDSNKCDIVQNSKYAYTLGIKNANYGMFIFSFLSIITFLHIRKPSKNKKTIIYSGIIIGAILSIYFLYIQHFILKTYCKYCLIVDISLIIALILILLTWKK